MQGYVLDSACAFTKGLEKPISRDCALACAKAGSPLVILTANGTIDEATLQSMNIRADNQNAANNGSYDNNFASLTPFWDMLFGTAK